MPPKGYKDMSKYKAKNKDDNSKKFNKTIRSRLDANEKYDNEKVDNIRVRVPRGMKEQMKKYIQDTKKYTSLNNMIVELIKKEMNID